MERNKQTIETKEKEMIGMSRLLTVVSSDKEVGEEVIEWAETDDSVKKFKHKIVKRPKFVNSVNHQRRLFAAKRAKRSASLLPRECRLVPGRSWAFTRT